MEPLKDVLNSPDTTSTSSPMRNYFRGKTVFLTGGTGFLGQLYVEKLLRSEVKSIFLLTRSKKGKSPQERFKQIFSGVLFAKLSKIYPNYLDRITVIEGDTTKLDIGISQDDRRKIVENCEIFLHAAADVRFDEALRKLLITNLRGTRELLKLAEEVQNLQVFAYISTAFSHCYRKETEEKFYKAPVDPEVMIKIGERYVDNDTEIFDNIQYKIIQPWPNTYVYTKSLCEELVRRSGHKFPICVIRPTIVIATHEDPVRAWANNIYGLNGILVASGMGVLRSMNLDLNVIGDIICADFVVNSTLSAIWVTYEDSLKEEFKSIQSQQDPQIYHVSSYEDRPLTWGEIQERMVDLGQKYPPRKSLWIPCPNASTNPFVLRYMTILYHVIPAFFLDLYLAITKSEIRLMPVYRKVQRFMVALTYFMTKEFKFTNSNMKKVYKRMSYEDKEFFAGDVRRLDWYEYSYHYVFGLRLYIGLEGKDQIEAGRKKHKKILLLHYLVLTVYYLVHGWLLYLILNRLGLIEFFQNQIDRIALFIST